MIYEFIIKDDCLSEITRFDGVSGNKNVYLCEFDITCGEENAVWFAVFKKGENVYITPISDKKCAVPYEILEEEGLAYLGCYAECDGEKRISTNWLPFAVEAGAYSDGTAPVPPDEDLWETLLRNSVPVINENGNWFTYDMTAGEYVDTGFAARGEQGIQGPKGDKGDKGDAGEIAGVKVGGTELSIDASGKVNITNIPKTAFAADVQNVLKDADTAMRIAMYGKNLTPTDDGYFVFTAINGGAAYSVRSANTSISGNIVIPYEHNGLPVKEISITGFINTEITGVTIPGSVETVGGWSFNLCNSLSSVTICDGVKTLAVGAFADSPNLSAVIIPDSVVRIDGTPHMFRGSHPTVYCSKGSYAEEYCVSHNTAYVYPETSENKVTAISAQSTNEEYPSAKAVYDLIADLSARITALEG